MALASLEGFDHLVISVSDMDRSIRFYRDVLGWEPDFDERMGGDDDPEFASLLGIEGAHGRTVGGHIGKIRVELVNMSFNPSRPRGEGVGLSIFSCRVSDAQKAFEECKAMGVPMARGGEPYVTKGCRIFFIDDPDGQTIEFVEFMPDCESPWTEDWDKA